MSSEFSDFVVEMLESLGNVYPKRMFGGYGIFKDGKMFALIADDELYFKIDAINKEKFVQAGSHAFTYESKSKKVTMSYMSAPEDSLDDADLLCEYASSAIAAALRSAKK